MDKEKLFPWIERLTKAATGDYKAIVGEMSEEFGIKVKEGWKLLKEAGFDPKTVPPADGANQGDGTGAGISSSDAPPAGAQPPAADGGAGTGSGGNSPQPEGASPGENKPPVNQKGSGSPPAPPASEGKKRVKCEALKGGKITIGNGEIVDLDQDGIFEVGEEEAVRLLTIPGYEEA